MSSGIAGLLNVDQAPIDACALRRMTTALAFRGSETRVSQPNPYVALAHAPLRLEDDQDFDHQPCTIDGREWIVADVRIDARQDLIAALKLSPKPAARASDAELILHAYRKWGDDCLLHLLGDFTFAIWDAANHRLFCARDHLGVKPFYFAERGGTLVFGNALDCVRSHPSVSSELDEAAIADFLLFGANQNCATTSFRDIRRLRPAHCATFSLGEQREREYWTLPVDDPVMFRRADDYTDRFVELLDAAVSDRLRTRRVGVLMSGGLDSPALAAAAVRVSRERQTGATVHALTCVYDRLIPDDERQYAGMVAARLDIPIHYDVRDDETSIADWDRLTVRTPEPVENPPAFVAAIDFLNRMTAHARVIFYGEGPDNALRYEWRPYLSHLLARRDGRGLARAISQDLLMHPRVPLWSSVRQMAEAPRQVRRWRRTFPAWLDEDFSARVRARDRWDAAEHPAPPVHPLRPHGHGSFSVARWQPLFEDCDLQAAIAGAEFRHPYLDLRLLQYMLALPAMPWCRNKLIVRRAMRGVLPDAVLRRRKATMRASADLARVKAVGFPRPVWAADLGRYVVVDRLPSRPESVVELRAALRPLGLNYWLRTAATS